MNSDPCELTDYKIRKVCVIELINLVDELEFVEEDREAFRILASKRGLTEGASCPRD